MNGTRSRFDGGQVRERIIRTHVNAALADLPPALRKLRYDEEYKRQTEIYNQERNEKKRARGERKSKQKDASQIGQPNPSSSTGQVREEK